MKYRSKNYVLFSAKKAAKKFYYLNTMIVYLSHQRLTLVAGRTDSKGSNSDSFPSTLLSKQKHLMP